MEAPRTQTLPQNPSYKLNLSMCAGSPRELKKWGCEGGFDFVFWILIFFKYFELYTQKKHTEILTVPQAGLASI